MARLHVLRSESISPSFRRVTVTGNDLAEFQWLGYDQWFRLFLLQGTQTELRLPSRTSKLWYAQWLAMPANARPHCANYTVRAYRPEAQELDIDFVMHRDPVTGELDGRAAAWALGAQPGEPLALLDEGRLFNPPADTTDTHLVADESGLPAVEGILASLPATSTGTVIIEVPDRADIRDLTAPPQMTVTWVIRSEAAESYAIPGAAALETLASGVRPDPLAYGFAVGESALATGSRRHLVGAGLAKDRITFCGFWKGHTSRRAGGAADRTRRHQVAR